MKSVFFLLVKLAADGKEGPYRRDLSVAGTEGAWLASVRVSARYMGSTGAGVEQAEAVEPPP